MTNYNGIMDIEEAEREAMEEGAVFTDPVWLKKGQAFKGTFLGKGPKLQTRDYNTREPVEQDSWRFQIDENHIWHVGSKPGLARRLEEYAEGTRLLVSRDAEDRDYTDPKTGAQRKAAQFKVRVLPNVEAAPASKKAKAKTGELPF